MHSNTNIDADIFCKNYSGRKPLNPSTGVPGPTLCLFHSKHFCSLMSCISPFPTMSQVCNTSQG